MSRIKTNTRTDWYNAGTTIDIQEIAADGLEFRDNSEIKVYVRHQNTSTQVFEELPFDLTLSTPNSWRLNDAGSNPVSQSPTAEKGIEIELERDISADYTATDATLTAGNAEIAVFRNTELTQDHSYQEGDKYYATNNEEVTDKNNQKIQELDYRADRSLQIDQGYDPLSDNQFIIPRPEPETVIGWNDTATALINYPDPNKVLVSDNDTTPRTLSEKLVDTASITWTEVNDGGDETLEATVLNGAIDHDGLANVDPNEHVDHTTVSVLAGAGLTGGGTIDADRTLAVDESAVNHDALLNFVANEHVDHSAVETQTNLNSGLSGGGDLTATRALAVDISNTPAAGALNPADKILVEQGGTLSQSTISALTGAADNKVGATVADTTPGSLDQKIVITNTGGGNTTDPIERTILNPAADEDYQINFDVQKLSITESQISDLDHTDTNAIHGNAANEISALTDKATPVAGDLLIIEDSAAGFVKKKVDINTVLGGGTDADAIHDNVAGEINAIANKATPVGADVLLIEDSAAGFAKKNILVSSLPSGGASPLTTKGDLYTYDTGDQRLPVGADGFRLEADSAETTGLKWVAGPDGSQVPPPLEFNLHGIASIPLVRFGAGSSINGPREMTSIRIHAFDNGTAGTTRVRIHRSAVGPSGAASVDITLPFASGESTNEVTGISLTGQAGDVFYAELVTVAIGGVEDLSVECFFGSEGLMSSLKVGETVFTDLDNLISGVAVADGIQWSSFLQEDGSAITASGGIFEILAIRLTNRNASTNYINIGYADTSVTFRSAAPSVPVYPHNGALGEAYWGVPGGDFSIREYSVEIDIPDGKIPFLYHPINLPGIAVYAFGYQR